MNLGQFLGLPMTAGPRDIPRGEDELGNILYEAPGGARYTKKTAPANKSSIVKALAGKAKANPWETIGDLVRGAAQGAWQGVSAPGRALRGEPMTYGDVAATAMDWGLVNAPGLAFGKYDPATVNIPVYQGRSKKGLTEFFNPDGVAWGTTAKETAEQFAGKDELSKFYPDYPGEVYNLDFDIKNPMELTIKDTLWDRTRELAKIEEAKAAGFDGLSIYHGPDKTDYVAFDPAQVSQVPPRPSIRAYHGSPHDFDRFDMSKIGTGEGAQAYGHGLYFAEAEGVAKGYRDKLAPGMGDGALRAIGVSDGDLRAMRQFTQSGVDPDVALRDWLGWTGKKETPELRAAFMQEWDAKDPGRMYEVNINADPNDFLDWDAPLSEQPTKVRDITDGIGITPEIEGRRVYEAVGTVEGWKPGHVNNRVSELAANKFREAGIPGIKYYDQGSRAGKEGTRNYVVFDDALIEILRKYGMAGAAPLGAILGTQDDEKQRIRDFLNQ